MGLERGFSEWNLALPDDYRFVVAAGDVLFYEVHFFGVLEFVEEGLQCDGVAGEGLVVVGDGVGGWGGCLGGVVDGLEEVLFVWLETIVDFEVGSCLAVFLYEVECEEGGEEGCGDGGEEGAVLGDGEAEEGPGFDGLPVVDDGVGEGAEEGFGCGDVVGGVGVGDEADFDVFVFGAVAGVEGGAFLPVEDDLCGGGGGVLEGEVFADHGGVVEELDFAEVELGALGWAALTPGPRDDAGFPAVPCGAGGTDFDGDEDGLGCGVCGGVGVDEGAVSGGYLFELGVAVDEGEVMGGDLGKDVGGLFLAD